MATSAAAAAPIKAEAEAILGSEAEHHLEDGTRFGQQARRMSAKAVPIAISAVVLACFVAAFASRSYFARPDTRAAVGVDGSAFASKLISEADAVLPHEIEIVHGDSSSQCKQAAVSSTPPKGLPQPSPGCAVPQSARPACKAGLSERRLKVSESALGLESTRVLGLDIPKAACEADTTNPAPLSLWFHGQFGHHLAERNGLATASGYAPCALSNGHIIAYPKGMNYYDDSVGLEDVFTAERSYDMGTGWNVGSGGNNYTCVTEAIKTGGFKAVSATAYSCYRSCVKLGQCGKCNWSHCRDDVAFVREIIKKLADDYCIDMSRIYVGGQSNGAMLTHHLYQQMPDTFAAINPIYGVPLQDYALGKHGETLRHQKELSETAILMFHGRQDKIIPYQGGPSPAKRWSWYYVALDEIMSIMSAVHGCKAEAVDITESILDVCPGAHKNFKCFENQECSSGRRVIKCLYEGAHGDYPQNDMFGCVSYWFFNQFRRTSPATVKQ